MGMHVKTSRGDDQTKAGRRNRQRAAHDRARRRRHDHRRLVDGYGGRRLGLCQQKKTIFMATLTHGDETTNQNCHKHTFRRYNDAYMSAQSLARRW
jgi:hypothetical protein